MKVFVTGATGAVGRPAVRQLVAAGHEVTAVARTDAKATEVERAGARARRVDLFDAADVRQAVAGHDVVVNLATHIPPLGQRAPGRVADLLGRRQMGALVRSQRVGNQRFREATGWAPRWPDVRLGLASLTAADDLPTPQGARTDG
jgi:NAD(P)-dependent dehydrogenase (short-subunit alcohol dehydrogenase family)